MDIERLISITGNEFHSRGNRLKLKCLVLFNLDKECFSLRWLEDLVELQ